MTSNKTKVITFTICVLLLISVGSYHVMDNSESAQTEIETEVKEKTSKLTYEVRNYYYNQLIPEEQILYDNIEASKEKIMQNQKICIGQIESSYDEACEKAKRILDKVMWAYRLDNPVSSLWLEHYERYIVVQDLEEEMVTFDIVVTPKSKYSDFKNQDEMEKAMQVIQAEVDTFVSQLSGTDEEKLRSIHDWILSDAQYDKIWELPNNSNLYGGIIQKKSICGGLTYSFKYVADKIGIPVISVIGTVERKGTKEEIRHVWNEVMIDGEWYLVDLSGDFAKELREKPGDSFFMINPENSIYHPWEIFRIP